MRTVILHSTIFRITQIIMICTLTYPLAAQGYWQQEVNYNIDVTLDVQTHRLTGTETIEYVNHSPDTITEVFYHLFWNAFHPGSEMDIRAQTVPDPDWRISRLKALKPDEYGYIHVEQLRQDGSVLSFTEEETILKAKLHAPILPGQITILTLSFNSQVPKQVRRSGRDNVEGIDYSMSQWYPKLCAYDPDGWHPDPYISREFYSDFGDFDVDITIDGSYCVAASGVLQNANDIGFGYEQPGTKISLHNRDKLTWHFLAKQVHDFVWAADPDYTHDRLVRNDGVVLHFFYQKTDDNRAAWSAFPKIIDRAMDIINSRFGKYPYETFSFIQGGDGGMEYPMATLITGNRSLPSLLGVGVHEMLHSWFQGALATNESLYAWMDEGFANYAGVITMQELIAQGLVPPRARGLSGFEDDYQRYFQVVSLGIEEPMTTHADHFKYNAAYEVAAYSKGNMFLAQLEYMVGPDVMTRIMVRYFNTWKFKHPRPPDFLRIAEKESGMVLDWYYEYWVLSAKRIDYGISDVEGSGKTTTVTLQRYGEMPMPLEILVTAKHGPQQVYYIPVDLMRAEKSSAVTNNQHSLEPWSWVRGEYRFDIPLKVNDITSIEIDPSGRLADTNWSNNRYSRE